jgi:hypothetical protein
MKATVAMVAVLSGMAMGASAQNRTIDGSGNNVTNPGWGMLNAELLRMGPANYADGMGSVDMTRPSPRAVSNAVGQHTADGNPLGLSAMVWQWGQFIDHDFNLITENDATNLPIAVPTGDPFFDPMGTGTQVMNMHRSNFVPDGSGVRQYQNAITHFLDGSVIYGSDQARADDLRSFSGGRLRESSPGMLPFNDNGLPNAGGTGSNLYISGDVRANEQVGLTGMHALFMREHNRTADALAAANPGWSDEQIYQMSRKIVGAQIQKITYDEWLPAFLGEGAVASYAGYDDSVNASMTLEFSTAAYRFGHSMLNSELPLVGPNGQDHGSLGLRDAFFDPNNFADLSIIDRSLKGLTGIEANNVDTKVVDDVRNFLFGPPGAGGLDLLSLNINRGRDNGIGTYNEIRIAMGLAPAATFADVTSDPTLQAQLASVYASPDEIDAWIGFASEDHVPGAIVGETLGMIFIDQFERLRDGDRYWYENDAALMPYLDLIEGTTLGGIMEANLDVGQLQYNVFFVPAPASAMLLGLGGLAAVRRRR